MEHHDLDVYPIPWEKTPMYISEPWLIDRSIKERALKKADFSQDIEMLISQIEIYDQIWYVRHISQDGEHSLEAKKLVEEFIEKLEEIPNGGAECFPFEIIDRLREEYLGE